MTNEKMQENVNNVSRMLNNFGFNNDAFCELMTREHRTLQQSFTRLCIAWLATCASDDYRYDGRNEASHEVAKMLLDGKDNDIHIPFI